MTDRVIAGLTDLAEWVASRYKEDPGGRHLMSVKRAEIEIERLRQAVEGIDDDYMTSEHHHPGYVLIPTAKFEAICSTLSTPSKEDKT